MKSGWTRLVRMAAAMLVLAEGLWAAGAGAAEVKNVTAEYAWPWGVELHYEVVGTMVSGEPFVVTATDRANNKTYTAAVNALSGNMGTKAGAHQILWELDKQGIKLQSTNVVFTVMQEPLYCVVDLSGGANASSYPITYMDTPPSGGFNTDAYKTTKLVLRRIPAGTFTMGDSEVSDNPPHQVTLTKPFYIGLFEVTQKQYQLVTGSNPSGGRGDMRPVEQVTYREIRGSSSGTNWPTSNAVDAGSFMGKFRSKTGLDFDLPTEAQWEYACRAGTTSWYNNGGNSTNDLNQLGRWCDNGGKNGMHTTVGSYKPNAWGLYDMHGNVWEWCLDWYAKPLSAGTDPKGPATGVYRVIRGGSWEYLSYYESSACRANTTTYDSWPGYYHPAGGFRLARTLPK